MPTFPIHPHLRAYSRKVAVAIVLTAYALPLSLGAFSELSHGAVHLLERLEERQSRATAMGLAHLSELNGARSPFTHTHDGVTHAHTGAVDALLSASEQTDDDQDAAAPMVKLSAHAPAANVHEWLALGVSRASNAMDVVPPDHPRPLPPLPPPRG